MTWVATSWVATRENCLLGDYLDAERASKYACPTSSARSHESERLADQIKMLELHILLKTYRKKQGGHTNYAHMSMGVLVIKKEIIT